MITLDAFKKLLAIKYDIKYLGEVKTIIRQQITKNIATCIIKIDQLAFIRDLVIEKNLTDCDVNIIPIKVGSAI